MVPSDPTYFLLPAFESHSQLLWSDFFLSIKEYFYIYNTQKEKLNTNGTHKIEGGNRAGIHCLHLNLNVYHSGEDSYHMHIAVFRVMRSCVLQLGTGVPTYIPVCQTLWYWCSYLHTYLSARLCGAGVPTYIPVCQNLWYWCSYLHTYLSARLCGTGVPTYIHTCLPDFVVLVFLPTYIPVCQTLWYWNT
jgi:hypothetical protein